MSGKGANFGGMTKKKTHKTDSLAAKERAVLVGLILPDQPEERADEYLAELAFLAETAGAKIMKVYKQNLPHPNSRTFVGKGKMEEIKAYVQEHEIDLVIFDDVLSPKQSFTLEEEMEVKIMDRNLLILDIFASRAQTAQAKNQVELAQMQYMLPRLRGMWTHLERQKGGIGMRGPGEQEIETDRRVVNKKITLLKRKLELIDQQNTTRRKNRGDLIRVGLVGYTNVGKSTLMNLLSKSDVFAEDKLFATLDTTVRKIVFENTPFLLSDTVGFIRKLPIGLVESFKSTLDEARESDILLHIVDVSHENYEDQIEVVKKTLQELGAGDKPTLMVFNKIDLFEKKHFDEYLEDEVKVELMNELENRWESDTGGNAIFVSAIEKRNINELRADLLKRVREQYQIRYPYQTQRW